MAQEMSKERRAPLSTTTRLAISIIVTGLIGAMLEYLYVHQFQLYSYTSSAGFYVAIAVYAFLLGPLVFAIRKASVIVQALLVLVLAILAELFNQYAVVRWDFLNAAFVNSGPTSQRFWEFPSGMLFGIRQPFLVALVASALTSVIGLASILLQRLLSPILEPQPSSSYWQAKERLFQDSVVPLRDLKVKRDFSFLFLRVFMLFNLAFLTLQVVTLIVDARDIEALSRLFVNPVQTSHTLAKEAVGLLIALIGAFNSRIRREAAILLIIGHVVAVGAQLWAWLSYSPNPLFPADHPYLLTGIISDAVVIGLAIYVATRRRPMPEDLTRVEDLELRSPASTVYKNSLAGIAVACVLYAAGIVLARLLAEADSSIGAAFGGPDPFVTNSITKYGAVAAILFLCSRRASLRKYFLPIVIVAMSLSIAAALAFALAGDTTIITRTGTTVSGSKLLLAQAAIDSLIVGLILVLRKVVYHVDYQISSLSPSSAECVIAAHEAFRDPAQEPESSSSEVLVRLNEYVAEVHGRRRGLLAFPFWILEHVFPVAAALRPPFSTMSIEERRWMLRRYVVRPHFERRKSAVPPLSDLMSQIGEVIHALLSLAYFTTHRAHAQIGYVLPDARERLQSDIATQRPPNGASAAALPVDFNDPVGKKPPSEPVVAASLLAPRIALGYESSRLPDEIDYCVVGSGAAGGVVAYRLGASVGKDHSICVLERGAYNSPLLDFSDDELRMIRSLYTEGGLQMSRTFDFTILQGETVGGSTVVNNAICLQMPEVSRREWNNFGIDTSGLDSHYDRIRREIRIEELKGEAVNERVESLFSLGVAEYNASCNGASFNGVGLSTARRLSGNFNNCLGCGLCNIGCRRLRKLSVLETYLPWAQAHGVKVFSNSGAVQCETSSNNGRKRVTAVVVRKDDGEFHRIRINKGVALAAGAIASSRFLMRSELGGDGVGKGMSCNYAFPTLVEFGDPIDAFDGLQITMFAAPESFEAIFETTYNAPGAYSIALPLHFGKHAEMMNAYRYGVNFGALVGSDPSGSVSRNRDLMFGRAIEWQQTPEEVKRLKNALATLVRIAKGAGGSRIVLPTRPALVIPLDGNVDQKIEEMERTLDDKSFFNFATAHPQGGNMMGDRSHDERVVEPDFRVRDCDNLFVCDASIFPRGVRVNPQWTIMAMASIAAERIVELTTSARTTAAER